ncbi:Zn-dependent hydrolase [Streptacidiphilus pinicola]|uniref:Zn-dependent hydrolase n=1 Tax=Streptacidiphilus pinicola TaxID=2219663 RepID=A0A2X0KAE5_9ACTN|nr:M20/M25/M40 family metallo-hydrolase [Streptacidiphilus pinicola]RAG84060.1 Zn-dependent hydrolase [Streptacidiphilus pinicola]
MSLNISAERLLADLTHLAQIGSGADGGIHRVAGSAADFAARDWLDKTLRCAGLDSHRDPVGNVFGRVPGSSGPWLLMGSHADTVPGGGRLDGAYGVIAAIEVLRTLHEAGHPAAEQIEVVAFWDEEGVTAGSGGGLVGSSALCRHPHVEELSGYLELHIEQGPRMDSQGIELAAVTGIVGVRRYEVTVQGEENHAGTTPFSARSDAGRVASRTAAALQGICQRINGSVIGNVGAVSFGPGAPNVVPGSARLEAEIRAGSDEILDRVDRRLREVLARIASEEGCTATLTETSAKPAAHFDADLVDLVDAVCRRRSVRTERMVSYAGHDASVLSTRVPTAMLFVPSTGGFSHSAREDTPDHLLVLGAQALLDSALAVVAGRVPQQLAA